MLQDAIDAVTDSDDAAKTLLVGGLFTLLGFLLIPLVPVAGYLLSVLDRTREGKPVAEFDDWSELFADGLKAIAVVVAYSFVPAVLAIVLFVGGATALASGQNATGALVFLAGVGVAAITWLAVWYVVPAALSRLAVEKRVDAAFEFGALAPVLRSSEYATGWLVALVVLVVGSVVVGTLAAVPVVGWLAAPLVSFPVNVVAFAVYGRAYGDAVALDRRNPEVDARRPAM